MLIRDRDSRAMLGNLSVLGIRSPWSSKSRVAILTEPRIRAAPRNGCKGTDLAGATARFDDRCGSGRATFVPMMESTDLEKCDDLASGRRLDRAGMRTVFI